MNFVWTGRRVRDPRSRYQGPKGCAAWLVLCAAAVVASGSVRASPARVCSEDAGIVLPPGFCATVFADNLGHVRHLAVAPGGVVYVNTWSGRYYRSAPPAAGFVVALKDSTGAGHADIVSRFGGTPAEDSHGGTGIAVFREGLYVEESDKILRYPLPREGVVPTGRAEAIVSGLPLDGDHPMHPFAIDAKGQLFVDLGSASNACERVHRMTSEGEQPCAELRTRGGIWRYDATRTGQVFSATQRYATGIRNGEGMSFDAAGRLFVTQHGRDQLYENWHEYYTPEQGHELPAEVVVELVAGADYGWPTCYFDGFQRKLVLAPEYGGDGKKVGECATKRPPVAFFPAHWAPNALLVYSGRQFPAAYHGGAFIAFHGSWNRAPALQGGYSVVFQPLADGRTSGDFVVFADGFAGPEKAPGRARYRPSGLAIGPDGALYIGDDVRGRIWRVTYEGRPGDASVALTSVVASPTAGAPVSARPPVDRLPLAPGVNREQLALGDRIFHGEASGGTCSGCHASDARGTDLGPDLTSGQWIWGDGSLGAIKLTIADGVPKPKQSMGVMPPLGGAALSGADVAAVAAYVWAVGHADGR
jgi:glucose/arabinose dehydrogenase/mono/diheme cytochrome c family protein